VLWFFFVLLCCPSSFFFSKFFAKNFWQRGQLVDTIITPQVFWVQAGAYMQVCQTHRRLTRPSGTVTSTVNWHKAGSLHVGLLFAVRGEGLYWLKGLLPQLRPWDTDSFNKVEWMDWWVDFTVIQLIYSGQSFIQVGNFISHCVLSVDFPFFHWWHPEG